MNALNEDYKSAAPFPRLPRKWIEAEGSWSPQASESPALGKRTGSIGNALAAVLKPKRSLRAVTKHKLRLPAVIAVTICSAQTSAALWSKVRPADQTEKGGIKSLGAHDPDAPMAPSHCHLLPCIFIPTFCCKYFKISAWVALKGVPSPHLKSQLIVQSLRGLRFFKVKKPCKYLIISLIFLQEPTLSRGRR